MMTRALVFVVLLLSLSSRGEAVIEPIPDESRDVWQRDTERTIDDLIQNSNPTRDVADDDQPSKNSPSVTNDDNINNDKLQGELKKEVKDTTETAEEHGSKLNKLINISDIYFVAIVAGCSAAGLIGLIIAVICWFRLQRRVKAASDVEYPAYGVVGPIKERGSPGDRKLAQSAQMYHYQHQKQQMIAMEKANNDMKHDASDDDSEEENDEGDYTVYECPGLAPTGEMEVKNPLFADNTSTGPTTPTEDKVIDKPS